eukprot:scaffold609444_cov55-Prasinocladus_malaysianus.AAC.1
MLSLASGVPLAVCLPSSLKENEPSAARTPKGDTCDISALSIPNSPVGEPSRPIPDSSRLLAGIWAFWEVALGQ